MRSPPPRHYIVSLCSQPARRARGLTHETDYDWHALVCGFQGVLDDLSGRMSEFSILARKFCTDCLEVCRHLGGALRLTLTLAITSTLSALTTHDLNPNFSGRA